MPRQTSRASEYLHRVMSEQGLTARKVSQRANEKGFEISTSFIHSLILGKIQNPGIQSLKGLAAGLDRSENEVAAAFGLAVNTAQVSAPKKRVGKPAPISPPQPKMNAQRESNKRRGEVVSIAVGLIVSGIILLWPAQPLGAVLIAIGILIVVILLVRHHKKK